MGRAGEEECAQARQDVTGQSQQLPPPCDLLTPLPASHGPGPYARGHRQVLGSGSHSRKEAWPPDIRGTLWGISHYHR